MTPGERKSSAVPQSQNLDSPVFAGLRAGQLALCAGGLFLLASVGAYMQVSAPYQWHERRPWFSFAWFLQPLEWNIDSGLPRILGNINTLAYSADQRCVWIAGDTGLLAVSGDRGRTWTLLNYSNGQFRFPQGVKWPCGSAPAAPAKTSQETSGLLPIVYAAERNLPAQSAPSSAARKKAPDDKTQQNSPVQQSSPHTPSSPPSSGSPSREQTNQGPQQSSQNAGRKKAPDDKTQQNSPVQQSSPNAPSSPPSSGSPSREQTNQGPQQSSQNTGGSRKPTISLFPGKHNFGPVYAGATARETITVRNLTNGTNALSTPTLRESNRKQLSFAIEKTDCGIQSKWDVCEIHVSFSPKGVTKPQGEEFDAVLEISDEADNQTYTADFGGLGLPGGPSSERSDNQDNKGSNRIVVDQSKQQSHPPNVAAVEFTTGRATLTATDGATYESTDEGQSWTVADGPLRRAPVLSSNTQLAQSWKLSSIFLYDSWAVGPGGVLLRQATEWSGKSEWRPASVSAAAAIEDHVLSSAGNYGRFIAPWYWLALLLSMVLAVPILRPKEKIGEQRGRVPESDPHGSSGSSADDPKAQPQPVTPSIGNQVVSDKPLEPGERDALGLTNIAAGLSFFLRNEKTRPPLVIGINGRWGSGKSSLMNLLEKNLEDYGAHPVWFNAWHHQKEEQLLAALLQAVKEQAVPPLGEFSGLMFRARLLFKRIRRYWLYFALLAAGCILVYRAELYLRGLNFNIWSALAFFASDTSAFKKLLDATGETVPGPLTILAAVIALVRFASRGLVAFGTKPASLLASVSGSTSAKDLDAQTAFRQRFATEFCDVTSALGRNQRMLILIDDLDRCRPEKVREVMEAVNFLISSGDCFVVLGMARDIVEHYVGLSFSKIVDSMRWEALGLSPEQIDRAIEDMTRNPPILGKNGAPGTADGVPSLEICAKRREFARLYLDKLIQIQVSVPEPTAEQKCALLESEEAEAQKRLPQEQKLRRARSAIGTTSGILEPLFQFALVTVAIAGFGVLIGNALKPGAEALHAQIQKLMSAGTSKTTTQSPGAPQTASVTGQAADNTGASVGTKQNPGQGESQQAQATPSAPPAPTPEVSNPRLSPLSGKFASWPLSLVLLGGLAVASSALRRMPIRVVQDTSEFSSAVNAWYPLVLTVGARNTPRTARRFQNRVRYLAMRQRASRLGQPLSTGERLLRRLYKVPLEDHLTTGLIVAPEPLLVALAAIDEFEPDWMQNIELFRAVVVPQPGKEQVTSEISSSKERVQVLRTAKEKAGWPAADLVELGRSAYLAFANEIDTEVASLGASPPKP
jgi:hypothetical protein